MNEGNFPGFSAGRPVELYLPEVIHEETLQANGAFDIQIMQPGFEKFDVDVILRSTSGGNEDSAGVIFNLDTTITNYHGEVAGGQGSTTEQATQNTPYSFAVDGATSAAGEYGAYTMSILNPSDTTKFKQYVGHGGHDRTGTAKRVRTLWMVWESTAPITRIQIRTDNHPTDLFVAGSSVRLIGWRRFRLQP